MSRSVPACWLLLIAITPLQVVGDTFVLRDGGRIEGDWLNPTASPLTVYEIRMESGGTLTIDAERVKRVVPRSPKKTKYLYWLGKMPPTADGHWRMAKWCADNRLPKERMYHLQSVLASEPDHSEARAALGYRKVDGEWILADELMMQRGYVKHKGRWRLPQDIAIMQQTEKNKETSGEWTKKIRRWQRSLGTAREAEAVEQLLSLSDPATAPIIVDNLAKEENPAMRRLWIRILGQLATPGAVSALMGNSLADPLQENRLASLAQLERLQPPQATAFYVPALASKDNARIRRAAIAIKRLGNESAIKPLINALVSEHKVVISQADPNRINSIFGSGSAASGTGFSTGKRPKVEQRLFTNREALDALIQLTNVNFQFDQDAWRKWYTERDMPGAAVNLRRDL